LGGRKVQGWRFQISLGIGGLYLSLGGLSLPLHLEVVATFGSHYFPGTITIDYFSYIVHGVLSCIGVTLILLFIAHWI
jgi:hypothetical protein